MNELGDYLEKMRQRHPRLSMRRMALEAGVSENRVRNIIKGIRTGARPETLKALADRWGTEDDYYELMQLAGYPVPESIDDEALLKALEPVTRAAGIPDRQVRAIYFGGGEGVYNRLHRLAQALGHYPSLRVAEAKLSDEVWELIDNFDQLSPDDQKRMLIIVRALLEDREEDLSDEEKTLPQLPPRE
jgi:transcriptional regulator with XRE-family HTH domain